MQKEKYRDAYLEARLEKYDVWLEKGHISYSSRVIPVGESLEAKQWVLPTEHVMALLEKVNSIAVQDCECRTRYKRCDNPVNVCLLLDEVTDKFVAQGEARRVSLAEAGEMVKLANKSGLVHLALYMPDHKMYALCSCCICCCHDLQLVQKYGRNDLIVRSEYVAETDFEMCLHCGECVPRCPFAARVMRDGTVRYEMDKCLGCGLCVSICPVEATSMTLRGGKEAGSGRVEL